MENSFAPPTPSSPVSEGLRLYAQGQVPEALWNFFEAAGSDPENPLNHYLSGLALRALGLEDEARAEWQEVPALTLHQAVLAQAIGADAALAPHNQWACRVAQHLLQRDQEAEKRPHKTDMA